MFGGFAQIEVAINYTYDPLYRLTAADYSTGDSYHYAYDSVGNRLTQDSSVHGLSTSVSYNYDIANRLADVDGVPYVYDANGNLLNDGQNTYTYDSANRLTSIVNPQSSIVNRYNGLGDRLSQNGVNYTLDLNAGLTQVLDDGTNTYTYGPSRISQQSENTSEYFLGDALGSVRQLTNQAGTITYSAAYDPYGVVTQASGASVSAYGYTGESQDDATGMVYLRARYYNVYLNQFIQPDTIVPDPRTPADWNRYAYVRNNPINYTDPSGYIAEKESKRAELILEKLNGIYGVQIKKDWGYLNEFINTDNLYIDPSMSCEWMQGNWRSVHELELVLAAVKDIARELGTPERFKTAMNHRPVRILRVPTRTYFGSAAMTTVNEIVVIPNYIFGSDEGAKGTIVHELAHAWDGRQGWRLSTEMMSLTKSWKQICFSGPRGGLSCHLEYDPTGEEGPTPYSYEANPKEDWAESFMIFTYPSFKNAGFVLRPIRKAYIERIIKDFPAYP